VSYVKSVVPIALIYLRVSTDEQADRGLSLQTQEARGREYCRTQGFMIGGVFADVMSGRRDDRPHYQEMLNKLRELTTEGMPVVIVLLRLDRLGRNVRERVRTWEECSRLGAEIHSATEGGRQNEFTYNILAAVAQEESRQTSERVKATWHNLRTNGWHRPTVAAWGFLWRPATDAERRDGSASSALDVDPLSGPLVAETFARVAAGVSTRAVAEWLATLTDTERGGLRVSRRTVQDALRNPIYAGRQPRQIPSGAIAKRPPGWRQVWQADRQLSLADRPRGRWPAIVDDATWLAVQDRLDARKTSRPRGAFLLTGLLSCPACAGTMHGETLPSGKGGSASRRYRCGGDDRQHCHQTANAAAVEQLVSLEIQPLLEYAQGSAAIRARIRRRADALVATESSGTRAAQRVHQLEQRLEQLQERGVRASERWLDGRLDDTQYWAVQARLQREIPAAESELAAARAAGAPERSVRGKLERFWVTATHTPADGAVARRAIIEELIKRVVAIRERRGQYRLQIEWTPVGKILAQAASDIALAPAA
jgi:site-specific DNA recombinase